MTEENENKNTILSPIRGVLRIGAGAVLGAVTFAVALTRGVVGTIGHAALFVGGVIKTAALGVAQTLSFSIRQMRGRKAPENPKDDWIRTKLEGAYESTSKRGKKALSNISDVFSGKEDKKLGINTPGTLIHSVRLMMAMSPEEIDKANKLNEAKRSGNKQEYKELLKKKGKSR